jgi:hypothetical protein
VLYGGKISSTTSIGLLVLFSLCSPARQFFDACDGIFLNYHWNETALQLSAQVAGARKSDVFCVSDLCVSGLDPCRESMFLAAEHLVVGALTFLWRCRPYTARRSRVVWLWSIRQM